MRVIQFNLRAFFSVRTWPWMMLFYKLRPLLRSAQVEKELAALQEDFAKLKDALDRSGSACRAARRRSSCALIHLAFSFQVRSQAPGGGGPPGGSDPGEERPDAAAPSGE